jgi:hypothetical protein
MAHHPKPAEAPSKNTQSVVLFGLDETGKPKAARFEAKQASLAAKAAAQLELQIVSVVGPLVDVAARLPAGRIHASGRAAVPHVRPALYETLLVASGVALPDRPEVPSAASSNAAPNAAPDPSQSLPSSWDAITRGHLVIIQAAPAEGWYEALVEDLAGDMLTVRWRDYPRDRRVARHRNSVALLYPRESTAPLNIPTLPKQQQAAETSTSTASSPPSVYPATWDDIGVDHLVACSTKRAVGRVVGSHRR